MAGYVGMLSTAYEAKGKSTAGGITTGVLKEAQGAIDAAFGVGPLGPGRVARSGWESKRSARYRLQGHGGHAASCSGP
eukprot:7908061-Pyramimonas_sp.AAC.1